MNTNDIVLSIAPIFLLIVLGYGLRRGGFPGAAFWQLNDKLAYWLLFPALLFAKTSTIDLSGQRILTDALVIYSGLGGAVLFALIAVKVLGFSGPTSSSVLQGAARHNSFLALAVAERLFGSQGLSQAALFTGLLVPVTNIIIVSLMVLLIQETKQKSITGSILRDLARNPLLIAVILGIGLNLVGVTPIPVIDNLTDLLGRAALPMMLLGVGASIRIRAMGTFGLPTLISIAGKMVIFPLMIVWMAQTVGLSDTATLVAVIYGSVPTAASAYTLARQMGGNAQLMSTTITIQTGLSFLSVPLSLAIVQRLMN